MLRFPLLFNLLRSTLWTKPEILFDGINQYTFYHEYFVILDFKYVFWATNERTASI